MDIKAPTVEKTSSAWVIHVGKDHYRCSVGRAGVTQHKREGDGATPCGEFPLRAVYYRPDRIPRQSIHTFLTVYPINKQDAWCDDPCSRYYNQHITLPFKGSYEHLWLKQPSYDVMVVVGYNDKPVQSCLGSAIFMHIATKDYQPTAGCIALDAPDLLAILPRLTTHTRIRITLQDITIL